MADLPGLKWPWAAAPSNRLPPIASLSTRPPTPRKASNGFQNNNGAAASTSASSAMPSTTRSNEWCKRRALAEHTTEDLAPLRINIPPREQEVSPMDMPSTSGRLTERSDQLLSSGHQPMLQLVAAWDSLASRLPANTGTGPDADLLVNTLKLVLASANQAAISRALSLASRLAEVAGAGIPLDAGAIAAGILAEAFPQGYGPGTDVLEQRLGHPVVALLSDLNKVRRLPARIELYDDEAAAALRELCLAFYDVRSTAVEVVARLHSLQRRADVSCGNTADADLQVAALEALQIYAPLGHALGLGSIVTRLEDLCFQVLFPASYEATTLWLHQQAESNAIALEQAKTALQAAAENNPRFRELASGLQIYGRTKSPYSTLKKLLRLGNTAKGGRSRGEVYDLIGLRAVVVPRSDLAPAAAEAAAVEACYLVEETAHIMWKPVDGRSKDYLKAPKDNGYQSLHSAVVLEEDEEGGMSTLELQIRTQDMHFQAESGEAAHAAYKGGLDASQARQLREWTEALLSSAVPTNAAAAAALQAGANATQPASEALFRSLDLNGDGKVSLEELRHVVAELGDGSALDGAAEALLAAVDSNSDGEVSLSEFLEFQRRVGLVHAASAMDEATAAAAEELLRRRGGADIASTKSVDMQGLFKASRASYNQRTGPQISNRPSASALQSWNSRAGGSSDGGDSPRSSKARRKAQASFVEKDSSGSMIQQGWGINSTGGSLDDANGIFTGEDLPRTPYSTPSPDPLSPGVRPNTSATESSGLLERPRLPELPSSASDTSDREASGWKMERAMSGFMRMFQRAGVADIAATWELRPLAAYVAADHAPAANAAGQPFGAAEAPIPLPRHGPCIVGAVRNRDCDVILDVPTVSGRHARLEVIRQRSVGLSKCVIMDLGSTNGTWVNRARITPFKEVPLYPGDVVWMAEPNIAFEVQVWTPNEPTPSAAAAVSAMDAGSSTPVAAAAPAEGISESWGPAVMAALRMAAALEAEAASRGVFAPLEALGRTDVGDRARKMLASGDYQAAYMLLLGSVMATPDNASLWAQLGAMERQRARWKQQGSSSGTTRVFLRAAVERFEALTDPAPRRAGLSRVFSSWAQLEYDMRNDGPARILFQKAVRAARSHPAGPAATDAAKLLFTWAAREWKLGDAPLASRLCKEALEVEPGNPFALTLLGNIEASSGDVPAARDLFRQAIATDRRYVTALQSWARLEATAGNLKAARGLFRRALKLQPENVFVLQAWGVAEGRAGRVPEARAIFTRCTKIDPGCRAAWHAWGKLEEDVGEKERARELYSTALQLKRGSVETLSALGRLERMSGDLVKAQEYLEAALKADSRHAPSMNELAQVLRAQGSTSEAYRLEKKAKRMNQDRRAMLAQVKRPQYSSSPAMPAVPQPTAPQN